MAFDPPSAFPPRTQMDWLSAGTPTTCCDTMPLRSTLERLVDFDRINHTGEMRLSVGAVNVRTGPFLYLDSAELAIRAEDVMASTALPPACRRNRASPSRRSASSNSAA